MLWNLLLTLQPFELTTTIKSKGAKSTQSIQLTNEYLQKCRVALLVRT